MIKQLLLTVFALMGCCTAAWADVQINETNFPDENFRNWVLRQSYGMGGVLTDAEIAGVTSISVSTKNIQSLKGIEFFTALTTLNCGSNQLTALDVSNNTALTELKCYNNQLTELDVSGCTALTTLYCYKNQLTELDLSGCTALTTLYCYRNQIKGAAMDALVESLPTMENGEMYVIHYQNEQNYMTVEQVAVAKAKGWTPYYYNGTLWKEYAGSEEGIAINAENFPDENFRNWVLSQEYGQDGVLTDAEIAGVTSIRVSYQNIQSLKGIEYFTALTSLWCGGNQLTELDVSGCTALTELYCYENQLTELDVSNNTVLTTLWCYNNQLTELNISGCTALTTLYCDGNQLTTLDVSGCTALYYLYCGNNKLTALDVSKNTALKGLICYRNQLTALDVSQNTVLTRLDCYQNLIKDEAMDALVESLPIVRNGEMYVIWIEKEHNVMTTTQVAAAKAKGWIPYYYDSVWDWKEYAGSEPISEGIAINEENFPDENFRNWVLSQEYGKDGVLTDEEIAGVIIIQIDSKNIQSMKGIEYFTALKSLICGNNQLAMLDVSQNTALTSLYCSHNQLTALNLSKNTALKELDCGRNQLTELDVSQNTALTSLGCGGNQLTVLDVSQNTALTSLYFYDNQLTELDVSQNTALTELYCYENRLTILDVTKNTALKYLDCWNNRLTKLDVSQNTALTTLVCCYNLLTELNVSGLTMLTELYCYRNQLTELDVSQNTALTTLWCYSNQLTELDVSQNTKLKTLDCYSNQIKDEAMDALVESLPTVSEGYMRVIYNVNEGNVMTVAQVAAAKAKGWTPYYYDNSVWNWIEYAGSDDEDGISKPTAGSGNNGEVYDLSGRRLQRMQKGINIINGKKLLK